MSVLDFLDDFGALSQFGATPNGGVDRQAGSEQDGQTREWFRAWLTQHGLEVRIDGIGNIFGLAELVPGADYVLLGSHLDSQPLAGRFDGAYGVLAAAHAVVAARDQIVQRGDAPRFNLCVVDWFNEEGCRFAPSMMGSGVFTGLLDSTEALATTDRAGTSVATALAAIHGSGADQMEDLAAYLEIHVEQGRSLDDAGTTIGIVADTWTARKIAIRVVGDQAHTGAAPMADRRDALLGAAHLIVAVRDLIDDVPVEQLHTAVSEIEVSPNSPVTIAREVELLIDLRAPNAQIVERAVSRLTERFAAIEERAAVRIEVVGVTEWAAGPFLDEGLDLATEAAEGLGLSHSRVVTVAGHDATNLKDRVPTMLMFVPSVEGISHNEREYTRDADLLAGVSLLTDVARRVAMGELHDRMERS